MDAKVEAEALDLLRDAKARLEASLLESIIPDPMDVDLLNRINYFLVKHDPNP